MPFLKVDPENWIEKFMTGLCLDLYLNSCPDAFLGSGFRPVVEVQDVSMGDT